MTRHFKYFWTSWLCSSRYGNSTSYFSNQDLNIFSYIPTFDKYHTALYSSNAVPVVANLCDVYLIFFAHLELCCISRSSIEAFATAVPATSIISSTSALVLLAISKKLFSLADDYRFHVLGCDLIWDQYSEFLRLMVLKYL